MEPQSALDTSWVAAANSRDHPGLADRQQRISELLSQLTGNFTEPWFHTYVVALVQKTYPKQHRCVLDATLQRFIALSPLHCGCILEGFLSVANPQTLNTPIRRDIATLFKAPAKLSPACWPQQGAAVCSIVAYLATDAVQHLWTVQQQQQATGSSPALQSPEQRVGIAIGWLADCIMQAVPQQQLPLMQLLLAASVTEFSRLQQQQALSTADKAEVNMLPPSKRQRLSPGATQHTGQGAQAELQQHQLPGSTGSSNGSSGSRLNALQAGTSILTAVCCCERMQHGSVQLVPAAAAAAASAAASNVGKEDQMQTLQVGAWLYQQLASQLTGPSSKPTGTSSLQQQASMTVGMQPGSALQHILQQLAAADCSLVVGLVRVLLGTAGPGSRSAAAGDKQQQQEWLLKAAQQWQPPPMAAAAGPKKSKKGKQAKQQALQTGAAGGATTTTAALLLSSTAHINATWLCKHLVPVLVHTAAEAWQPQQLQDSSRYEQPLLAEAAALVELLADAHLLLPAAGEVLVSARFLAEALKAMDPELQKTIAAAWQQKLVLPPQPAAVVVEGQVISDYNRGVEWKVLQPMLCLLNHLEPVSPFNAVLAAAVQCTVMAAVHPQQCGGAGPPATAGAALPQNSTVREVVRHLLLPVRFALQSAVRVLLLQRLLCLDDQLQQEGRDEVLQQQQAIGTDSATARLVFNAMQQLLKQESAKLAQGMQLVAAVIRKQKDDQGITDLAEVVASIGSAISPEQTSARDLAVVAFQVKHQAALAAKVKQTIECQQLNDWPASVQQQLADHLKAVDVDAYDAVEEIL